MRAATVTALLALCGCTPPVVNGAADMTRHCSDLVAQALTSPDRTVIGAFACMSTEEQNFWHRWAIARDDQLPAVVRFNGLTPAGAVDGRR